MRRVGSYRIIRPSFCIAYNRFPVDNESGCQGQCPRIVSIVFGHIKAELQIDFSQIFRKGMNQTEFSRHRICGVAQNMKGQFFCLDHRTAVLQKLRGDGDQLGSGGIEFL
jgi:hypothetical protein